MNDVHPYVKLARVTVERLLNGEAQPADGAAVDSDAELWNKERACFVSIKTSAGGLRGCIGTIAPTRNGLDMEIIANATAASTGDPRFPPMTSSELKEVTFSVDVLSRPEPVSDRGELDPSVWGVIVSKGARRGVLLPNLDGVDTVEEQLDIAARKAGIGKIDSGVTIERFRVDRYKEA